MKSEIQFALESGSESILLAFGHKAQMIKTCEELGELTTQLCKVLNGSPTTPDKVIDEIADVMVMVHQMRAMYGGVAVDERIIFKLGRTLEYIRTGGRKTQAERDWDA